MKKVCVISGSRADYSLLIHTLEKLKKDTRFELQICVTGMHLSSEFGMTYKFIEKDGFHINKKVDTLISSDTGEAIGKSIGLGVICFSDVLRDLTPDIILVVGDRFEILAAVISAMALKIPVAHCHGGELTEGAIDDSIRHSITKLSHLHFVSHPIYKKRVVQLGEEPDKVFVVGALGLENIKNKIISKTELERKIGRPFAKQNFLVTFHPETLSSVSVIKQLKQLFIALNYFKDSFIIFTQPNSDHEGLKLNKYISDYVDKNDNVIFYPTLGTRAYLSALHYCDLVIGNSSSGIIEAPSLGTPTINIGKRQKGRVKAKSVIDVNAKSDSILNSINKGLKFNMRNIENPYESIGYTSKSIVDVLNKTETKKLAHKKFNDLI